MWKHTSTLGTPDAPKAALHEHDMGLSSDGGMLRRRLLTSSVVRLVAGPIEMEMGHGVPPIQQALDHGIRPSLSADVETEIPSEFFTQMRAVFTLQRMLLLARQRAGETTLPNLLTVREAIEFATIEGARDNHLDHKVGTLTPGKEADIIMLRMDQINVMPVNNAYGAVVLGMDTGNVDTVFIGGKLRKSKGKPVGVDLNRVGRLAHQSRDYVVSKAGWPGTRMGGYLPGHCDA